MAVGGGTSGQGMEKDLVHWLYYFALEPDLWESIRTMDILERAFREVRRRTHPMNNFFTNKASSDRIMYGITEMLNKNWRGKTLKQISTI